jgi:hypothetical protein
MDVRITGFAGINNLQDKTRLKMPTIEQESPAECRNIVNTDISDTFSLSSRGGFSKVYTGVPHSFDPNGSGYFVDGTFKLLYPDATATLGYRTASLCSLLAPLNRMSYALCNYLTVCSNGVDLFMAQNGVIMPFLAPTEDFKIPIRPAQVVAFFKRRLYYAIGPALLCSDADNIEQSDTRDPKFEFNSNINMVMPLDNGIIVGADKIYWLAGRGAIELKNNGVAYDGQAVEGTDRVYDGALVGKASKWGAFRSTDGVCLCNDSGQVENVTLDTIIPQGGQSGTALIRENAGQGNNINQYISWV